MLEALERAQAEWGDGFEPPLVLKRLVAQGRLGKKSGQGFFPYPQPDDGQSRETIALETRGDVGIVWLNRPPANPLSPQVIRELTELWEEIDGKLRVVVFASSNIFTFSAGADIKEFTKMSPDKEGKELIDSGHAFMRGDGAVAHVTIAAVNSIAFGGGWSWRWRIGETAASWRWRATSAWRRSRPPSASRRSTWGSSPASAAPSGCRAWWARPRRSR